MSTAALATLGCKVNQCESAYLEEQLVRAHYHIRPFTEKVDLYCINTCTVTSRAAMQSRQLVRRAVRTNPGAEVVAAGCHCQIAADEIAAIRGVTHILGTHEKTALLDFICQTKDYPSPFVHLQEVRSLSEASPMAFSTFSNRTRAFLKVQDGCDSFCSYCIVPYARGRSRSVSLTSVLEQMKRFLDHGYREVVLTGVHLGQWGLDLKPQQGLDVLLHSIIEHCPPPRLRLSSLEPGEITADVLGLLATEPVICPHLHIPLQSGSSAILRRMNRPYLPTLYQDLVLEAVHRIPDLSVGADVLVGFPGETDKRFQETFRLVESLPLAYLHIFPFSPRPGTPAATMRQQTAPAEIKQRCRILKELDRKKRLQFLERFIGEIRPVLVENRQDESSGLRCGFSDNYLPVLVQSDSTMENEIVMARLTRLQGNRLVAEPL
jgi:threonylcarbamoyladenosine tRNA methylthiotransferase MtaB